MSEKISSTAVLFLITLFDLTGFGLLAFKTGTFDTTAVVIGVFLSGVLLFQYNILAAFFKSIDRYVIIIMNFLITVGVMVIYRIDPEIAYKQLIFLIAGLFVMAGVIYLTIRFTEFKRGRYVLMGMSILILLMAIVLGNEIGGSKNWISLGPVSVQPSELVKIVLVLLLASYFADGSSLKEVWPILVFSAVCMVLLVIQKDLGAVMLYFGTTLIVYYVCTSNWFVSILGIGAGAGGAVIAYKLFSHIRVRVAVWKNPWLDYQSYGYQIVQGLLAIASGGLIGVGIGRGMPSLVPARHTDYIFAVICEEFGLIFGMAILAFYIVLIIRGAIIAR
ncbi:MAG: FtsW/RodA/SpoVE family cell cycle protein, partial [Lachnospiraceae bacterium]|nr:FtsW/RodA/SpoVE family cell cycle protein [Lachnospiraceae bacterium]